MVRAELTTKLQLTDADLDRGGYRIVTTIDKRAQDAAVAAVQARMPLGCRRPARRPGCHRPGDGAIRAMCGGGALRLR